MNMAVFRKTKSPALKQMEDYLHHCEFVKRYTVRTVRTYRKGLSRFITETDTRDLQRITNRDLEAWQAALIKEGKTGKTVNNYRDHVVGCLKFLQRHRGLNPEIDFGRIERAVEDHREAAYFTALEIEQIKAACEGLRELLLVSLLYDSGMRISELRSLQVEHISGPRVKIVQGKGRKDRVTFISDSTQALLSRWLHMTGVVSGFIFPSPAKFNDPLSEQQIRDSINAAIRRAGFAKGSAHSMRHSFITAHINNGADIFTIQTLAGHSDPKTTRRYYHTNAEQLFEKYLKSSPVVVASSERA